MEGEEGKNLGEGVFPLPLQLETAQSLQETNRESGQEKRSSEASLNIWKCQGKLLCSGVFKALHTVLSGTPVQFNFISTSLGIIQPRCN